MSGRERAAVNVSALHVFQILRLISTASVPLGVAEISRRLDLPTSTVHRALVTLERAQYLMRLETAPKYELGPMPQFLARALFRRFPLRAASLPFLKQIAGETGETTSLGVRIGWYQMRIAVAYGSNDLYSPGRLGETRLLHQDIAGRSILAFLAQAELARYRRHVEARHPALLPQLDSQELKLRDTRELGFAAESRDHGPGHAAVAVPLRDASGEAMAAILVSGSVAPGKTGILKRPGWAKHVVALERQVRAVPEILAHSYLHLDPDEITINLP